MGIEALMACHTFYKKEEIAPSWASEKNKKRVTVIFWIDIANHDNVYFFAKQFL